MLQRIWYCTLLCVYIQIVYSYWPAEYMYGLLSKTNLKAWSSPCGHEDDPTVSGKIFLLLYKGSADDYIALRANVENPESITEYLSLDKPTVVYTHGFTESSNSMDVQSVVQSYLKRKDVNIMTLDWGAIAHNIVYPIVSKKLPAVGLLFARALLKLGNVIDLTTIHLIGHSLGSHVMGFTGRFLQKLGGIKPFRITGLDPAYPEFYPSNCHLRPSDAIIVVALHSDPGVYGTPYDTGRVDFYTNTHLPIQPGCSLIKLVSCNHQKSVEYFVAAVDHPMIFPSYLYNNKDSPSDTYFGQDVPVNVTGRRFFNTTAEYPFGEGKIQD